MRMISVPNYWADCYLWQYRKNGMCRDIIGDVFYLYNYKFYLHRN